MTIETKEDDKQVHEFCLKIKKYLELENVSVLAGAGTSFHLGAPLIREIPNELKKELEEIIKKYFDENAKPSYEDLFNCLQADRYLNNMRGSDVEGIIKAIVAMQKWLFTSCDTKKNNI